MIVWIGVGLIVAGFLVYAIAARRRENVRFSKFLEEIENYHQTLESEFVPAAKAAGETMVLFADAWKCAGIKIRTAQDLADEQQDKTDV